MLRSRKIPRTGRAKTKTKSSAAKVRAYRARKREAGLRLVQFWVPDVHSPGFAAEAHRQSLLAAKSRSAAEDQAFVDSVSIWNDLGDEDFGRRRKKPTGRG